MRLIDQIKQLLTENQEMSALELVKDLQVKQSMITANTISTRVGNFTLDSLNHMANNKAMTLSELMREILEDKVREYERERRNDKR